MIWDPVPACFAGGGGDAAVTATKAMFGDAMIVPVSGMIVLGDMTVTEPGGMTGVAILVVWAKPCQC